MRQAKYTDILGRVWVTYIPDGVPESDASMGVPVGPPSMDPLGLPQDIAIALHNELVARGLLTARDIKRRRQDVVAALRSALKISVPDVVRLYTQSAPKVPKTKTIAKKQKEVRHGT